MAAESAHRLADLRPIYRFALAALLLAGSLAGAQDYTLTKLPALTDPVAVNSSGQVTGLTTQTGHDSSFFWTRTGGLRMLGDLGGSTTRARAMNDGGAIVGASSLPNGRGHAFLWTPTGGMQDLGSPFGDTSEALAINSAGDVAGYSFLTGGTDVHAFFWSSATGAVDLGVTDGNTQSFPVAINDSAEVVGYQYANGISISAFRWTVATGMQKLDNFYVPFNSPYRAQLLGDNGQIVGFDSADHAALRLTNGTVQDLGTLPPDASSVALFLNNAGHSVGTSRFKHCCNPERTFFWAATAGMVDIGNLPKHQNSRNVPYGFNNRNQVVGLNGATYLWSPTLGLHQISGITFKFAPFLSKAFNDAGQMLGFSPGYGNAVLASPTMHVSVTSSQNPSHVGQSVTFTANVSAIVGLPPDGKQVTFKDGSKVLGMGTLNNGTAGFATSTLTVNTHSISVTYAGDDNYLPSKSVKLQQVVNP